MRLTQSEVMAVMKCLGVRTEQIRDVRAASSTESGEKARAALRAQVKRRFKQLARELHPDVTGGDAEKEEEFKIIKAVVDDILALEVRVYLPPVQIPVRYSPFSTGMYTSAGITTGTTSSAFGGVTIFVSRYGG